MDDEVLHADVRTPAAPPEDLVQRAEEVGLLEQLPGAGAANDRDRGFVLEVGSDPCPRRR